MQDSGNLNTLKYIVRYCDEIEEAIKCFDDTNDILSTENIFINVAFLCLRQISELTSSVTQEFKDCNTDVPWTELNDMESIIVQNYDDVDMRFLLETIGKGIPVLKNTCLEYMKCGV